MVYIHIELFTQFLHALFSTKEFLYFACAIPFDRYICKDSTQRKEKKNFDNIDMLRAQRNK